MKIVIIPTDSVESGICHQFSIRPRWFCSCNEYVEQGLNSYCLALIQDNYNVINYIPTVIVFWPCSVSGGQLYRLLDRIPMLLSFVLSLDPYSNRN